MAQRFVPQDLGGLGRLTQQVNFNRQQAEREKTGGLQRRGMELGIQAKESQLADFAAEQKFNTDFREGFKNKPADVPASIHGYDIALNLGRPDKANEILKQQDVVVDRLLKIDPKAAADYHNTNIAPRAGFTISSQGKSEIGELFNAKDTASGKRTKLFLNQQGEFQQIPTPEGVELVGPGGAPAKQKTSTFLVKDPGTGETSVATGVFDPATGELTTATSKIAGMDIVSKLGETGQEQTERKVAQKREETRAKEEEVRAGDLIERGIAAAESTAQLRRGIELMETIKTGGPAAISLAVKQRLGIEGADEGELSNSLGKAVLSQLRETFGAAFTENEGKRLANIEASFGKSTAANERLLRQALRISERTAQRARSAAVDRDDQATVEDIDDLLSFSLATEQPTQQAQPVRIRFDAQGNPIQ